MRQNDFFKSNCSIKEPLHLIGVNAKDRVSEGRHGVRLVQCGSQLR